MRTTNESTVIGAPQAAGTPARPRLRPVAAVALLVFAASGLGACDGDNLFSGDSAAEVPRVTNVSVPQIAAAGDTIHVRVDGEASRAVAEIAVSLRGAVSRDTTVRINPPQLHVSQVLAIPVPAILQDTLLQVEASVTDAYGRTSRTRQASVVVVGPPTVLAVSAPSTVHAGETITVRVNAYGARRIERIDLGMRGALQRDTSITLFPAQNSVSRDIQISLPSLVQDTMLTVTASVRDEAGSNSSGRSTNVALAIDPPTVELVAPATARAGMNLDVQVHAQSVRQVAEIRVEVVGALPSIPATTVKVAPTSTSVIQNVSIPIPGNILTSDIRVRAFAIDRSNVISQTPEYPVTVPLGQPVITSIETPYVAIAGRMTDVRIRANGARPLTRIEVHFRSGFDVDKVYTLSPIRLDAIQDVSVQVPDAIKEDFVTVTAVAIDVSGEVSEIVSSSFALELPVVDTTTSAPLSFAKPKPFSITDGAPARDLPSFLRATAMVEPKSFAHDPRSRFRRSGEDRP